MSGVPCKSRTSNGSSSIYALANEGCSQALILARSVQAITSKFFSIRVSSSEFRFFQNIQQTFIYQITQNQSRINNVHHYFCSSDEWLIILKLMEHILDELQNKKCWKSFLKTQCRRNKINPQLANTFTIVKIRKFYQKLTTMEASNKSRLKSSVWVENELKAYQWFLVAMSGCKGIPIQNYGENEWKNLSNIFNKQESILEYEAVRLINEKIAVKRKWEADQIAILQRIIKQDPTNNKWNETARTLFELSSKKYFRTGKQCRERWLNHLDPQKKHGQWESTEDRKMTLYILENGKKWSQIVKTLENHRTEHMIKNRFKTLLIKLKKKYKEILSERDLLIKFLEEKKEQFEAEEEENNMEAQEQSPSVQQHQQKKEQLEVEGLPVIESEQQGGDIDENYDNQNVDKCPAYRECQIQQVMTPCPIIYQTFTPTFLNTPNSLTFLMNYSFDQFEKNQNLFLKNT